MKKILLLTLSVFAFLPFAGQVSAATSEIKANDDTLAWFWGGRGSGYGWRGGYYPSYGYGYNNYGYGSSYGCCGYGYGGYGYGGCCY